MRQPTHFKYKMEDVECRFCTEYNGKKGGCTQKVCSWLAERIEAGVVGYEEALEGHYPPRDTPAYFAAMYLLTADPDTAQRTANCFCRDGIMLGYATTKGISPHGYTLLSAARDIYANGDRIALTDLADGEIIDTTAFCLIVNALLIARYGSAALEIQQKERQ